MAKGPDRFTLVNCLADVSAIEAEVRRLVLGLSESQFHAPAKDGGWSIGFCLEHLILMAEALMPRWRAAIQGGTAPTGAAELPYSWLERATLYYLEPPYRIRTRSAAWAVPTARRSVEDTVRRLQAVHQEAARFMVLCGERSRAAVPFAFPSGGQCRVGFSFDSMLAHERRHLWQAWRRRACFDEMK